MAGKLEKLTKVYDRAWEDFLYDPCTDLPNLLDVDDIPAKYLKYLKPLLGFTDDVSLPASTDELRRILKVAVPYWNKKPTEEAAVLYAIRMVTGNRFRAAGFFDFRSQVDKTMITEELEDFDPHAISFPSNKWFGTAGYLTDGDGNTGPDEFYLSDSPSLFKYGSAWGWITVADPTYPANDGIYEIALTVPGKREGKIVDAWPVEHAGSVSWTLIGWAGEYTTEVRIVDNGAGTLAYRDLAAAFAVDERVFGQTSGAVGTVTAIDTTEGTLDLKLIVGRFEDNERILGSVAGDAYVASELTGVLNRPLLRILMDLARPDGERLDVVYINFLDQFLAPGDLTQWTTTGTVTVPKPGGYALITDSSTMTDADDYSGDWGDQVTAFKFYVEDAAAIAEFRFFVQDDSNYYYVLVDYSAMDVELWKNVAGTPTQIGSSVSLPVLQAGVSEVVRIDALEEGSETRIRVKLAGDTRIDEKDTAGAFSKGGVAVVANSEDLYLELVEVNVLPTEIDRVGPNP